MREISLEDLTTCNVKVENIVTLYARAGKHFTREVAVDDDGSISTPIPSYDIKDLEDRRGQSYKPNQEGNVNSFRCHT